MTSEGSPGSGDGVFQTTNPFANEQGESQGETQGDNEGDNQVENQAEDGATLMPRITGVVSSNPFAPPETSESGLNKPLPRLPYSLPSSPGRASPEPGSPGPGDNQNPLEQTSTPPEQSNTAPSASDEHPSLEPTNSNVNGDRGERGTDIFYKVGPFPDNESAEPSQSDSDAKSKDERSHIMFADKGEVDEAPTNTDSSPDILEKVKSTTDKVKEKFHLQSMKATGPLKGFNPTNVRMSLRWGDDPNAPRNPSQEVGVIWRSRDNRKGRNSVVLPRRNMAYPNLPTKNAPVISSSAKGIFRNLYRMVFTFPYWDMAFWSGWSYTWGSVLFVIDGAWAWIPYAYPLKLKGIEDYAVGIFFFVGALLYQVGATMAYLEAVNDGSFHGSAMKRFLEGHDAEQKAMLDEKIHGFFDHLMPHHSKKRHEEEEDEENQARSVDPDAGWRTVHRRERPGSIYPSAKQPAPRRGGVDLGEAEEGESHEYLTWRWFPTWHALKTHHVYEIGYIACSIQLFGATLYSWCGLVALPGIITKFSDTDYYAAYYFPEITGSCCFLAASIMFLIETQERWWKIQPGVMGWWIGFWAMIGSWGFLFCGIFGVIGLATGQSWGDYQSELSSTWGSFGYLLSSLCQWYEAVNKRPVEELFNEPGEMKSYQVHLP